MTSGRLPYEWSIAADDELTRHWHAGLTTREIGMIMGKTKNAVIGRVRRINLPMRRAATRGANYGTRGERARDTIRANYHMPRERQPRPKPAPRAPRPPKIIVLATEAEKAAAWLALPGSRPKSLLDIRDHMCRWPVGEHPFLFCADPVMEGQSYCAHHHKLSIGTGTTFEQSALRAARSVAKRERLGRELVPA